MVLEAVRVRFGRVPRDIRAAVQRLETRDTLHMLLRQAMTCSTLEVLRDDLKSVSGSQTVTGNVGDSSKSLTSHGVFPDRDPYRERD